MTAPEAPSFHAVTSDAELAAREHPDFDRLVDGGIMVPRDAVAHILGYYPKEAAPVVEPVAEIGPGRLAARAAATIVGMQSAHRRAKGSVVQEVALTTAYQDQRELKRP